MKYIEFNTMGNLIDRIALSVLEECEYFIKDKTDFGLLELAKSIGLREAVNWKNEFGEYSETDVGGLKQDIIHFIHKNDNHILDSIKEQDQKVSERRRELFQIASKKSNPPPVLPPDHTIY